MDTYADMTLTLLRITQLQALTDAYTAPASPPVPSSSSVSFGDELTRASAEMAARYPSGDARTGRDTPTF